MSAKFQALKTCMSVTTV